MNDELDPLAGATSGKCTVPPDDHPASALRLVRVEYDDGPDRCTVCPRGLGGAELTTTWFTADAGAFVDLSEAR